LFLSQRNLKLKKQKWWKVMEVHSWEEEEWNWKETMPEKKMKDVAATFLLLILCKQ
jgi:hypothetical protein